MKPLTFPTTPLPPKVRAHLEAALRKLGFIGKRPKGLASTKAMPGKCDAWDETVGACVFNAGHRGRHGHVSSSGKLIQFGEVES